MTLRITATVERWPVDGQFIIARGAKQFVDVLLVAVGDGQHIGYGEGTAIYYRGETAEKCLDQVERIMDELTAHDVVTARMLLQSLMPQGAARNAIDCALWDLETKQTVTPLWKLVGLARPPLALQTAFTISLGTPERMAEDASAAAANGYTLLKLKLQGSGDLDRDVLLRVDVLAHAVPDRGHAVEIGALAAEQILVARTAIIGAAPETVHIFGHQLQPVRV